MPIFNEPGRGRKQCPKCQSYVGAPSRICENCKHPFVEGAVAPTEVIRVPFVDKGPGKGRKQCSNCNAYSGVRSAICPNCNQPFPVAVNNDPKDLEPLPDLLTTQNTVSAPVQVQTQLAQGDYHGYHGEVLIPAGPCPVKLTGTDDETVEQWANDLRETYRKDGKRLADSAIRYYAQQFYDLRSTEFRTVIASLAQ